MTIQQSKHDEYFNRRIIEELGATPEDLQLCVENQEWEPPAQQFQVVEVIQPYWKHGATKEEGTKTGFQILFYSLQGVLRQYYTTAKTPTLRDYVQIRYEFPDNVKDKYKLPWKQSPRPWYPPNLVKKYKNKEKIKTLFITEGVLSGFAGSIHLGIDIVCLTSISHFRDPETKRLHSEIEDIIIDCEVENVVVLWDGDCLNLSDSFSFTVESLDSHTKRPKQFYSYAKSIAELVAEIPLEDGQEHPSVYFSHIKSESFSDNPKGLDDLILSAKHAEKVENIQRNILALRKSEYFFYLNITKDRRDLYKYFRLDNINSFYNFHSDILGLEKFSFHGNVAYFCEDEFKVIEEKAAWAKNGYWVGDDFFFDIKEPAPGMKEEYNRSLKRIKSSTLARLHGKYFHKQFGKYFTGFVNIPLHGDNYKREISSFGNNFFNLYHPFVWEEKKGDFPNIKKFFKHLFGSNEVVDAKTGAKYNTYEMGLDYVQILLQNPTQQLPIICLYSPENNTGKSTLGKFLARLFRDNVVFLSSHDLTSTFNAPHATALLAVVDEAFANRSEETELIKARSTNDTILVNPKGLAQYSVSYFCKLILSANKIRMLNITEHDERFWVIQVHQVKEIIPNLLEKMVDEIPAFLYYLNKRKLHTPNRSRMHFAPSLLKTETFNEMVRINEHTDVKNLRVVLQNWFDDFPHAEELQLPNKYVGELLLGKTKGGDASWNRELMKRLKVDLLRDENGHAINKSGKFNYYAYNSFQRETVLETATWKGAPYVFYRKDFASKNITYTDPVPIILDDVQADSSNDIITEQLGDMPPLPLNPKF